MPRFLFTANYAPEGARALMTAGGVARRTAVDKAVSALGGHLVSFDFAFGADDAYIVIDLPDQRAAAALALTVNGTGVTTVRTQVLLTPEDIDAAAELQPDYSPPGASS